MSNDPFTRTWRTIVFAGAMLAAPAVAVAGAPEAEKKAPAEGEKKEAGGDMSAGADKAPADGDKGANKDAPVVKKKVVKKKKRPRGGGEGGTGRGFILS